MIKYGGHAMDDPALADLFAQDVVLMRLVGMNPVVVHGGGPQITDLMRRLGKVPEFVDGLRVTDAETVDIVRMALVGKVNREIVAALNQHGSYAVGLSGEDAGLITVEMRDERLGLRRRRRQHRPVDRAQAAARGADPGDRHDRASTSSARPTTSTPTPWPARSRRRSAPRSSCTSPTSPASTPTTPTSRPSSPQIDVDGLEAMLASGKADGGMIPKLQSCVHALRGGVRRAHILDGRIPHALLLEFFTREGIGTMIDAKVGES